MMCTRERPISFGPGPGAPADFRGDDHVLPSRAERLAQKGLGHAAAVDVRGVEEVDARVEGCMHELVDAFLVEVADDAPYAVASAECHGPETQLGDEETRSRDLSVFHDRN